MAHPAEELDVVALEAHAGTAAEAEATAGELVADLVDGDGQARRQALDHHREGGAVGLTGGQVTQHADDLGISGWEGGRSRIPVPSAALPLIRGPGSRVSCPCTSREWGPRRARR